MHEIQVAEHIIYIGVIPTTNRSHCNRVTVGPISFSIIILQVG